MKKAMNFLLAIILTAIVANYASADFSVGNASHFIEKKYAPNATISGWFNISLNNEPATSAFSSNLGGSINLLDLLFVRDFQNNVDYSCKPSDCTSDYAPIASSGESQKKFSFDTNNEEVVGVKLSGNINSINSFSMDISSDAPSSCFNQLDVDLLNDGTIDFVNNKPTEQLCGGDSGKKYGCFNQFSPTIGPFSLVSETRNYCQRINLVQSPGLIAGAWIKNKTSSGVAGAVSMGLYKKDGTNLGGCALNSISSMGAEYSCPLDAPIAQSGDYYVCVSSTGGSFEIKGYTEDTCGFASLPTSSSSEGAAYQIFAQTKEFASFGKLSISSQAPSNLISYIQEYLQRKYGPEINCPASGCIIPIRIKSNIGPQQVSMGNLAVSVTSSATGTRSETNFWNVTTTPSLVSSGFLKINLSNIGFQASSAFGSKNFSLSLGNSIIFSDSISVEKIPQIITVVPKAIPAAYPTEITAKIETFGSNSSIASYSWDFGDGSAPESTTANKATHTYAAIGNYTLILTITTANSYTASKSFDITVQSPANTVKMVLQKYLNDTANLKSQIDALPPFEKDSIEKILNLTELDNALSDLQQRTASAATDSDYVAIMTELSGFSIPDSISESKSAPNFQFVPDDASINLDALKQISGSSQEIQDQQAYINAVDSWYLTNVQANLDFKEFSVNYGGNSQRLESVFEFSIKKGGAKTAYLLIMPKLENINFGGNYNQKEVGDYIYIDLPNDNNQISFSTTQDVDFTTLPAFIAPKISELTITNNMAPVLWSNAINASNIILLASILAALVVAGFAIYLILAYWYKKKYENFLFKNRNDLYNIVSYVQNMKKQGVEDKKVIAGLRKSGWSSEQVGYLMKKYYGKSTGMFEISLGKLFGRK